MKNMRCCLAGFLLLGICSLATAQITVNFSSSAGAGGLGQFSGGSDWPVSGGYTFELGVFSSGFTPTLSNASDWAASWTIATDNVSNTGVTTWIDDGGATYFQATGAYLNNASPFTVSPSTQLYIWGYNNKTITSGTEWILLSNTNWLVQNATSGPGFSFIDTTDAGTYAVVGFVTNGGVDLKSAVVSAVPEPAAYAAFFSVAVLGLAFWNKRRKAA